MKHFNLERLNAEKIKLEEQALRLSRLDYPEIIANGNFLIDMNGNSIGTKGDMYTKQIMDKILTEGCLDQNPRPHYEELYKGAKYYKNDNLIVTDNNEIIVGKNDIVTQQDEGIKVWTPAHTISVNTGIECNYDLSKGESPFITLRPIAINTSVAEVLWIYQKESNDLVLFGEFTPSDVTIKDHPEELIRTKNPQLKFQLGI